MPVVGDSLSTPPPGSNVPGDLYVDLATKTLWLGVDVAVNPAGAVLVSDIMSIQPAINASLVTAKAYTDTQVATRAPTVHTHTAAQITDLTAAVNAIIAGAGGGSNFSHGMTIMYAGPLSDIGTGGLANWGLCDGTNGTPNLKDKFIIGAGNLPYASVNPNATLNMSTTGAHTHVINGHVLTAAEVPSHNHAVSVSVSITGSTDAQGNHQHTVLGGAGGFAGDGFASLNVGNNRNTLTTAAGNHAHNVSGSGSGSGATDVRGGDQAHNHTMGTAGDHIHVVTTADLRNAIPYFSMAFIMRLV